MIPCPPDVRERISNDPASAGFVGFALVGDAATGRRLSVQGGSATADEEGHSSSARYLLGLLVLLYVINYIDRQILSVLLEPIKQDLGVSDTAMGLLTGLAFALFYTAAGIPIARQTDRGSRRNVILAGVVVWSVMTACCGLARNFVQLALARVGVGVGEATLNPAAHSLISDAFPPERRATALSLYNIGGNVGIMLGFIAGGWIGETFGWRQAFLVVGLPGLAAAILVRATLREPPRGHLEGLVDDTDEPSFGEVLRFMMRQRTFRHLCLSSAFYAFGAYGFTIWGSAFLIRIHHMSLSETGIAMGLVQGIGGGLGTYLGGMLADRFGRKDPRYLAWVPALGGVLAVPLLGVFLFWPDRNGALVAYAIAMVFSVFFVGPNYAVAQSLARLRMRAQAAALLLFAINLIGLGIAPLVVGVLNDSLAASLGDQAIRYSLMATGATSLLAVFHSLLAARSIREDLAAAAS
jgi:predicted MFS family arabinose efflux permease